MFVSDPFEQTTAATNVVLTVLSLGLAFYLYGLRNLDAWKVMLWFWSLLLLAAGALLGAIVHGLVLDQSVKDVLWGVLFLSLGLAVALFVVNAINDGWGKQVSQRVLPFALAIAIIFFVATRFIELGFLLFIIYEGIAMLTALGIYLWVLTRQPEKGTLLVVCGIALTLFAAIVQAKIGVGELKITVIWQFDNNGLFHILQMFAVILLVAGVRAMLLRQEGNVHEIR